MVCCALATDEEVRENPQQFDCQRCAHADAERDLFAVNARALRIYRKLCGRTVNDLGLAGRLLEAETEGWTSSDVLDLLDRIERIRTVLDPPRPVTP